MTNNVYEDWSLYELLYGKSEKKPRRIVKVQDKQGNNKTDVLIGSSKSKNRELCLTELLGGII